MSKFLTFEELIKDPTQFQALVFNMSDMFKKPKFPDSTVEEYNETRDFKVVTAVNGRVPMASSISPSSGKPIIGTEQPLPAYGQMPTFGNEISFTAKEYNRIDSIQRAIVNGVAQPQELINFLFNYFERLAVGPLMTVDKLFYEAISNGTSTILGTDSLEGVPVSIDWKLDKADADVDWSDAENADGLKDLKDMYKTYRDEKGIIFSKFLMNSNTFENLQAQVSVKSNISSYFNGDTSTTYFSGLPSLEAINKVLVGSYRIAPIEIDDYMIDKYAADGASVASSEIAFANDRVACVVGDTLGKYVWTPADEQRRPDANVVYQDVNHVMIRTEQKRGKLTMESELSGIVIPSLNDQIVILKTKA